MSKRTLQGIVLAAATMAAGAGYLLAGSHGTTGTTLAALLERTHVHGIAVDRADPDRIYLATHHGFYAVGPDGAAEQLSDRRDDFMGFTLHPTDPDVLYASGHPEHGGNLGFVGSSDGGRTWTRIADGVGGPVDFHQMDVSAADPNVIYGVYRVLQVSRDGGRSWEAVGQPPEGIIDLAASSVETDVLYAATQTGLLRSTDGGRSWEDAHLLRRPATMVKVTPEGQVYAFMVGAGLIRTQEPHLRWQTVHNDFGEDYVLHFAVDPSDGQTLYAVTLHPQTHAEAVLASRDGGVTWAELGGE
jgi:hypothetical protein